FNRPYLAADVREFWSRWHISLSTWIRDYLYFPMGGSRGSSVRTTFNLFVTMLLAGLWHGAALNFVFWGIYHAGLLIAVHLKLFSALAPKSRLLRQIICFHLICFGWLMFRVSDFGTFSQYCRGLAQLTFTTQFSALFYLVLSAAFVSHIVPE